MNEKEVKYDPKIYGPLKADFLENVDAVGGWIPPPEVHIERLAKQIKDMKVEIQDLFQRYGHALDRIISLEEKVHRLRKRANKDES